jgi:hypothetical protein
VIADLDLAVGDYVKVSGIAAGTNVDVVRFEYLDPYFSGGGLGGGGGTSW